LHGYEPFNKGHGIDFYVDGARFLPDNVTVTKVALKKAVAYKNR